MSQNVPAGAAPERVTLQPEALRGLVTEIFCATGMERARARTVAEVLVWANLRGVDTHGVTRVPRYVEMISLGDMNPRGQITERSTAPGSVLIEADRAPGPVAMLAATDAAGACAERAGIGIAVVRGTTHTAALGYYTRRAAQAGQIGIAIAASLPNMAYQGARAAGVSTAPLSIAAPGGPDGAVVLDFASGIVSMGRLNQARKLGQAIPEGWALDREGNPTTDPAKVHVPLPMAGPKGAGLALMVELICSLLAGNPLLAETLEQTELGRRHRQNAAVIAIDIARFTDPATFAAEVARLARDLKALPRQDPAIDILLPGERGNRTAAQRESAGIPLPRPVFGELRAVAARLGLDAAFEQLAQATRGA
jgi:LDH2 family malate/lactate/ureidoglycolate dehydrogenase